MDIQNHQDFFLGNGLFNGSPGPVPNDWIQARSTSTPALRSKTLDSNLSSGSNQSLRSPLAHRSNTFHGQFSSDFQILGSALHEALVKSNNLAYLRAQLDLVNQQQTIVSLKQSNQDLQQELARLTVKLETTNLFTPSLPAVKPIPACIPETKCPEVKPYKKPNLQNTNGDTNGLAQVPAKPGRPTKDNPAVPYPFLVQQNGEVVDNNYLDKLHSKARMCFITLRTAKQAPQSWGKGAGQLVRTYVYSKILNDPSFSESLLLTEDYWKIEAFLIDHYHTWACNNLEDVPDKPTKRKATKRLRTETPMPEASPLDDPSLIRMDVDEKVNTASASANASLPAPSPMQVDSNPDPSPAPGSVSPSPNPINGCTALKPAPEVRSTQAVSHDDKPATPSIKQTANTTNILPPPVPSGAAATPSIEKTVETAVVPPPPVPPTITVNPTKTQAEGPSTAAWASGKGATKKAVVGPRKTVKNLCMADWLKDSPEGLDADFNRFFSDLLSDKIKEYQEHVKADAKNKNRKKGIQ
ncbi:hypothetical protein V5O48_012063 [Marasmius crinis-equi]|uniref:Uncharacterized protein n=1 Tax=Marasmius crinis-equi TaxID=585013 RepID=A0ABR3F3W1_9AGAR